MNTKIKDAIILIAMITFILAAYAASSQDIKPEVSSYVASHGPEIVSSLRADVFTDAIFSAFISDGEQGLDRVLNETDNSWYAGADVYLASDYEALISTIMADEKASYREKDIKKATISVASHEEYVLVMIYSFR